MSLMKIEGFFEQYKAYKDGIATLKDTDTVTIDQLDSLKIPFQNFLSDYSNEETNTQKEKDSAKKISDGLLEVYDAREHDPATDPSVVKSHFLPKAAEFVNNVDEQIATQIQTRMRMRSAKKTVGIKRKNQAEEETEAEAEALKIQTDREEAALKIQAAYRKHLVPKIKLREDEAEENEKLEVENASRNPEPTFERALKSDYYKRDDLAGNYDFFKGGVYKDSNGASQKTKLDVDGIKGIRREQDKDNKTVFLTDEGFPLFVYDNQTDKSALEQFQQDLAAQHDQLKFKGRLEEYENDPNPEHPYDSVSFVKIRTGGKTRLKKDGTKDNLEEGDIGGGGDIDGFKYAYVVSSDQSVETCYLSEKSFNKLKSDHDEQYSELIEFRRNFQSLEKQYGKLNTDKEKQKQINKDISEYLEDAGVSKPITGVNSLGNYIDDLAEKGDIAELRKVMYGCKELYDSYRINNPAFHQNMQNELHELDADGKHVLKVDDFFATKIKAPLSNSYSQDLISRTNESRKENIVALKLTDQEKDAIKQLGGYHERFHDNIGITTNRREIDNVNKLLNLDVPGTPDDGVYVERCAANINDLQNTFGNDKKQTEFVTVVFKGDTKDNLMYLTLKGTDFHVKVRMDPVTKDVTIDNEKLYKKDEHGAWEGRSLPEISRGKFDPRNNDIEREFRNFGVLAISDVGGVRKVSTLHNLKSQSYNLQSSLSKDVFGDEINDSIKSKDSDIKNAVEDIKIKKGVNPENEGSVHSDSGDDVITNPPTRIQQKIQSDLEKIEEYRNEVLNANAPIAIGDKDYKKDKAFTYTVSKNIYEKTTTGQSLQKGYELLRVGFNGEEIATGEPSYISCNDYNVLAGAMASFKQKLKTGQIDQETYDKCKDFTLNTLDDIVSSKAAKHDNNIQAILGLDDDAELYQSASKHNKIVARVGTGTIDGNGKDKSNLINHTVDENAQPQDRTLRRAFFQNNITQGAIRTSKDEEVRNIIESLVSSGGLGNDDGNHIPRIIHKDSGDTHHGQGEGGIASRIRNSGGGNRGGESGGSVSL